MTDNCDPAARLLCALLAERDHWKNYASMQSAVVCSGVVVPSDEYAALVAERDAAQAEVKTLREALEEIERGHIPSMPMTEVVDELTWAQMWVLNEAQMWVGNLRKIARLALATEAPHD